MPIKINQIRICLDQVQKAQGTEAVAAILKQVGAIDADTIDPADYPQVVRLCGHGELADGAMTCRTDDDEAPRRVKPRNNCAVGNRRDDDDETPLQRESKARKPSAMEVVVNSAASIQEGLNLAAKAVHARRQK